MKIKFFAIFAVLFFAASGLYAQQGEQQQIPDLKVSFTAGDLVFAYQSLGTIELTGKEVDAFVQVTDHFKPIMEKMNTDKTKLEDNIAVTLPVGIAQNFLVFMERAKLTGANAERFVRIKSEIMAKAQEVQKQMQAK